VVVVGTTTGIWMVSRTTQNAPQTASKEVPHVEKPLQAKQIEGSIKLAELLLSTI
jgi:hypothetical protein